MRTTFACICGLTLLVGCSSDSADRESPDGGKGTAPVIPPDGAAPQSVRVPIPGGAEGIGFDDLMYSTRLQRLLVPGGWMGTVHLVDPESLEVQTIPGFSAEPSWTPGDDLRGVGTADEGNGLVFVGDRTTGELGVVDPARGEILRKVQLLGYPDYLRYVEKTGEVWVGEPFAGQIEILKGAKDGVPVSDGTIAVQGGPQSLVIDQSRGIALTLRLLVGEIVAYDVVTRQEIGVYQTGCTNSHGLVALDEAQGFVFPGCLGNPRVAAIDFGSDGAQLDDFDLGTTGSTLVAFSSKLRHLYVRGDPGLPLAILGVSKQGTLTPLNTFDSVEKAHCLAADDRGGFWTCDWNAGALVRYEDPYPATE